MSSIKLQTRVASHPVQISQPVVLVRSMQRGENDLASSLVPQSAFIDPGVVMLLRLRFLVAGKPDAL